MPDVRRRLETALAAEPDRVAALATEVLPVDGRVGATGLVLTCAFERGTTPDQNSEIALFRTVTAGIPGVLGVALGALDAELFPTEVRGRSSGFLLVCGVVGSAFGLVLATSLEGAVGGLGPAIALCGLAPLLAAILVIPRLPETADRRLDDVSTSEE